MKKINYGLIMKYILILISILYLVFLYMDINNKYTGVSKYLKLMCILLCFFLSLLYEHKAFSMCDIRLLQIGLFLTVFADFFLLILDNYYEIGVAIFILVQIIYSIRYRTKKERGSVKKYIRMVGGVFLIYIVVYNFKKLPLILLLSLIYGICFIINLYRSIIVYAENIYPKLNSIMVVVGMILFLLCDINVAIFNIIKNSYFQFNGLLYKMSYVAMWFFYVPSQVLLSLSGYKFK
ncbi:MAG: hypothetical protein GXZ06_01495 [Tissierellia bacterium]|nr:hypothetical protein [Tissierellia bacterium]